MSAGLINGQEVNQPSIALMNDIYQPQGLVEMTYRHVFRLR